VRDQNGVSPPEYTDLRVRNRVLEGAAAHDTGSLTLTGDGEPERIEAAFVTASFFSLSAYSPRWDARSPPTKIAPTDRMSWWSATTSGRAVSARTCTSSDGVSASTVGSQYGGRDNASGCLVAEFEPIPCTSTGLG
jgi:hypothetical protein